MVFSPDGELFTCAVPSVQDSDQPSSLHFYKVFDPTVQPMYVQLCMVHHSYTHSFASGETPYSVLWHPVLNQFIVGMRDGTIKILYDPDMSVRGACLIEGRTVLMSGRMIYRI